MDLIKVMILIFSKLEQQWLYHWETTTNIDGGGGTTDAALFHLEDQLCAQTSELHPKIIDYFDKLSFKIFISVFHIFEMYYFGTF